MSLQSLNYAQAREILDRCPELSYCDFARAYSVPSKVRFTGWKRFFPRVDFQDWDGTSRKIDDLQDNEGNIIGSVRSTCDESVKKDINTDDIRVVGQWINYDHDRLRDQNIYVSVPSMTFGIFNAGDNFEIGENYFRQHTPDVVLEEACKMGYYLLREVSRRMGRTL